MSTLVNQLTQLELTDFGGPIGTTHFIGDEYPAGALTADHLEYRSRKLPGLWLAWVPVVAWDQVSRVVTIGTVPVDHNVLQIRRRTPRFALYQSPLIPEVRVDEENLRLNANQGYMVAWEWAADYGVDPRVDLLQPDYSLSQPVKLLTQSHYGPEINYLAKKHFDFWFAGGYLSRNHIRAQAKINGVWQLLPLSPLSWRDNENTAAYKFIGPWTLQLDLPANCSGVIIHRHTPRTGEVSYPDTDAPITESNMDPSTRHAFYVAVELGEELSKRVPCECYQYYTTTLYPVVSTDIITVSQVPSIVSGVLFGQVLFEIEQVTTSLVPSIVSGNVDTVSTNHTMPFPDQITTSLVPSIVSGSVNVVVVTHSMPFPDRVTTSLVPTIVSGNVNVIVVQHTMPVPDQVTTSTVPTIISGSLT